MSRNPFPKGKPPLGRAKRPTAGDRDVAGVKEGLAELDAGQSVPLADVEAWIDSWGTPNERPMPQARRRKT